MRRDGKRLVHPERVPQAHHLQSHDRYLKIDLHRFRWNMRDSLDDREAFLQELIRRHDFVDEADAKRLVGVDVVTHETVAQSVFESRQQCPHKTRVGAVAHLGLRKDGVFRRDGDMGE